MRFIKKFTLLSLTLLFAINAYANCSLLGDNQTILVDTNKDGFYNETCSLREAIQLANETNGHNFINFHPITNAEVFYIDSQLEITNPLTINGNGVFKTIIDAQHQSRIFNIKNLNFRDQGINHIYLNALSLQNGFVHADLEVETDGYDNPLGGGAILVNSKNFLHLYNAVITKSVAIPVIKNNNEPLYAAGGAIEFRPKAYGEISKSTLAFNAALYGSAVMMSSSEEGNFNGYASASITQSLIANNMVTDIAAEKLPDNSFAYNNTNNLIESAAIHSNGITSIYNSTIINNVNPSGIGAGILYTDYGIYFPSVAFIFNLKFSTVANNIATYQGKQQTAGLTAYYSTDITDVANFEGHFGTDITNNIIAGNYQQDISTNDLLPADSQVFTVGEGFYANEFTGIHEPKLNVIGIQNNDGYQLFLEQYNNKIGDSDTPKIPEFDSFEFYNIDTHLIGHLPLSLNDTLAVDNNYDCNNIEFEPLSVSEFDQKGVQRGMICDAGASELEN